VFTQPSLTPRTAAILRQVASGKHRGTYPFPYIYSDSPNHSGFATPRRVRCVVWHISEGSYESSLSWLTSSYSRASSNDLIGQAGQMAILVPRASAPWTNGYICRPTLDYTIVRQAQERGVNPNSWSHTIECAGTSGRGKAGSLTELQTAGLIVRTAQVCVAEGLSADPEHILRHAYFDSCTRGNCPGYSRVEMFDWIGAVRDLTRAWRGW